MWYPGSKHSGVTLKTFKKNEKSSDYAWNTSYFLGPWDYSMPINSDTFGNVLVSIAGTEPLAGSQSVDQGDDNDGTPIGDDEPSQQIPIIILDLTMIGVILREVGDLTENFVNGLLYANLGGKPSSDPIATLKLDISHLIEGISDPCYTKDIKPTSTNSATQIQVGNSVFMSIQATSQNNLEGQGNNVVWMHNGNIIAGNPNPSGSRPNTNPTPGSEPKPPFTIDENSPTYTSARFYNYRTKVIVKDPLSIARYDEVERFLDIGRTTDFRTINDLLLLMLEYTAKPKMIFNIEKVSIPDSHDPFQVGKNITVIDDISGLGKSTNSIADILSTGYEFDAYGDSGVGTYYCDLGIGSLYDYLVYENLNVDTIQELFCTPFLI